MAIRVGCCGWPVARARYFGALGLVEIQETFYSLPRPATADKWRAAAPATFEFALKAPQLITHAPSSPTYRRLRVPLSPSQRERYGEFKATPEVRAAWMETLGLARALRSEVVVFQCPASFTPTRTHLRNMAAFFEAVERNALRFAWEPRGDWPDVTVKSLCRQLSLIHCVDPWTRRPVWGEPAYFRLHGKGGYHYRYSDGELLELRALARGFASAYVLLNNTAMFDDARRFLALVERT